METHINIYPGTKCSISRIKMSQAVCETFLRQHLSKSSFSVKTILELVKIVKSSSISRDTPTIVKIVQDMYALDFVKEHLKTLPVPVRERLDNFMANSLDDFVALTEDVVVAVKRSGCLPLLCGMKSMTAVEQLGEKIAVEKAAAAAATVVAEKVAVEKLATDIANEVVAEATAVVDVSGAVTTAAVEVQVTAPEVVDVPLAESSSEPASSVPETKTDVSGAPVETTPA